MDVATPPIIYYLFLSHPRTRAATARLRRRGFPEESEHVIYTTLNRDSILRTVNAVFQCGFPALFPALPSLLAPSSIYQTHASPEAFQARALFLWRPIPPRLRLRLQGAMTVAIFVPTSPPLSAAQLSFILINLTYRATHSYVLSDYYFDPSKLPKLKNLAYCLSPTGAYAVAIFDNVEAAYREAITYATTVGARRCHRHAVPAVWPSSAVELLSPDIIDDCYVHASIFSRALAYL
ncbi:hypothetical protein BN946_scf184845.g63 [Trametes cinnabarina]|uniref:Uncharacterized protein n=1 Tax=Pycnoporus cinnabarinus TaxID=5643 RepID=A0A060SFL9_PYCCI|nr:hypothetical protein BN946_scf184845.g63 [Trametes cinnabarina]